ncbi:MAG: hypothetical protein AB7U85_03090 [Alphaproteobacteria bacterium]
MKTLNIDDYEKYKILSEAIGKGVLFTDAESLIYDHNSYFLNFFNMGEEDSLKGKNFFEFLDSKDRTEIIKKLSKIEFNSPYSFFITRLNNKNINLLEIEVIKLFFENTAHMIFLVSECIDTKKLNPYKVKSLSEFEKSNVLYAMEIASSYLANIYKRISSPIDKIRNYCNLLEKEMNIYGLSKFSKDLKSINNFTKELNIILNDLTISPLAILSQEEGYLENVDLGLLIEETATVVNIIAKRKNVTLVVLYQPDIGNIYTNKLCLFYCLINILDNIFYYNENSYISLSVLRKNVKNIENISFEINISSSKSDKVLLDSKNILFAKECMQKLKGTITEKNTSDSEKVIVLQIPVFN